MTRVGVLISGTGSNLQALIDQLHGREIEIAGVCSSRAGAGGIERARAAGIETAVFEDQLAMADWLAARRVRLVVCAGYMRILPPAFLERFAGRVINVHPSLLPAFKGAHPIEDALVQCTQKVNLMVKRRSRNRTACVIVSCCRRPESRLLQRPSCKVRPE